MYSSLRPVLLALVIHLVLEYHLHQAMDRKRPSSGVTSDQVVGTQCFNGLIQEQWITYNRLQRGTECSRSLGEDLFRDGIRGEKRTESQQVGGGWIFLFDTGE